MRSPAALLASAGDAGCHLEARQRGGRLVLWADRPDLLPEHLRTQLRANRAEILAILGTEANQRARPPHACMTCSSAAAFGFGPAGAAPRAWFCLEHQADGEAFLIPGGR